MSIYLFNSLSKQLELFTPISPNHVGVYSCGPTIYDHPHLGNCRYFVFKDLLLRVMKINKYKIRHIMNITDVDDKIIGICNKKNTSISEYTKKYHQSFLSIIDKLNILPADQYPKATDYIKEIILMIEQLINKKYAYVTDDGSVFYSIKKFPNYGELSGIDTSVQHIGKRVINDNYNKDNINDFALWKAWEKKDGDIYWNSPWGNGRPGWHIECSAMSKSLLGNNFDIHTGGIDLKFPHHDNEIAQSQAANDKKYVNYWVHCHHLEINNKKMSKSLNNFITIEYLESLSYTAREIRWVLLNTHYRSKLIFSIDEQGISSNLISARSTIEKIDNFLIRVSNYQHYSIEPNDNLLEISQQAKQEFTTHINNDLNISLSLAVFFNYIKKINNLMDNKIVLHQKNIIDSMKYFNLILGIMSFDNSNNQDHDKIKILLKQRFELKKQKDFVAADKLRDLIKSYGWEVEDMVDYSIAKNNSSSITTK